MHGLPSRPSPGPQAFCIGGFGWRRPESIFLKRTLDRPLKGLSILAGTGAGHPPLWCPTMALKIKIARDSKGDSPLARLCLLSSCEERRWPSGQTILRFVRAYHAASR